MATQDELKQQVAKAAVEYVKGGIIGVPQRTFSLMNLPKLKQKLMGQLQAQKPQHNVCVDMELRCLI